MQPCLYKILAACLERRLSNITDQHQPIEQAGFRKGFSTIDHIHVVDQVIEKYKDERNKTLYLAFIDYAKAFDSISHDSMWAALQEYETPSDLIQLIQDIYAKSISRVRLDRSGKEIKISRGVRQGDPLSPRLFILVLQYVMKDLNWNNKGIFVRGSYLSNLRFADDIVLFSESAKQLETMINDLNDCNIGIGLELNINKTKIMTNHTKRPIIVQGSVMEYVDNYTMCPSAK